MKKILGIVVFSLLSCNLSLAEEIFIRCENEVDSRSTSGTISKNINHWLIDNKKNLNLLKVDRFVLKKETNYSTKEYGLVEGPIAFDIGQNKSPLTKENDTYLIYGEVLENLPSRVTKINKYTLEMLDNLYDYKGFGTDNVDTSQIVFQGTVISKCTILEKKL